MPRRYKLIIIISLAVATVTATALFFVVNHIVNSGRLIGLINSNTDVVQVNYSSCSGTMLTRFTFKDLAVDGQDSMVKWRIRIKEASISPSLWRLPFKKFYTSILLGTGFSWHLEFKEHKDTGFNPDSYKGNWRLWFGRIELRKISEITVGKISYKGVGDASLDSDFYFWPEYELAIGPSRLQTFEPNFSTDFKFEVERVRFHDAPGLLFFKRLSSNLKFKGESQDLSFLNYYFRSIPWLEIHGSGAHLNLDTSIEKGIVSASSTAEFEVKNLALRVGRVTAAGSGTVNFKSSKLDLHFNDYLIQPLALRGQRLDFSAASKKFDLADPLSALDLYFDVSPIKVPQLAQFNSFFSNYKTVKIQRGSAEVSATLRFSTADNKVSGKVQGTATHVAVKVAGSKIETEARLDGSFADAGSEVSVNLSRLEMSGYANQGSPQAQGWWGRFLIADAHLALGQHNELSGMLHLSGRDGKPFLLALWNSDTLPFDLTTVSSMRDLKASAVLNIDPELTRFSDFKLHSSTLQAKGWLELRHGVKRGILQIDHPLKKFEIEFK